MNYLGKLQLFTQEAAGRIQQQNVDKFCEGPTSSIIYGSPLSSFAVLFNESMLRHMQKCTIAAAQRVTDDFKWSVTLDEIKKLLDLS